MRRTLLSLLAASTIAAGVPAVASAQTWMNMQQREYQLDQQIDAGMRSGQLTASEGSRLRVEFQDLARLEDQYMRNGLTASERADLDRRYDLLADRIQYDRRDSERAYNDRNWNNDNSERAYNDRNWNNGAAAWDDRDWRNWDNYAWGNVNQMQVRLDQRIDVGLRNGSLTRSEADRMRAEFRQIVLLEAQYSRNGLSSSERADLSRRLDVLDQRVRMATDDNDERWSNLNQRQAQFNQRLGTAVRDGRMSQRSADYLRTEFTNIARLEQQYRRNGLTNQERADLDLRFDRLETNFRAQINSQQYGYGYGQAPNLFDYLLGILR